MSLLTSAVTYSQNNLSLTNNSRNEIVMKLSNTQSVKGIQYIVASTGNIVLRGIEKDGRIAGSDWLMSYHRLTDSTMSVVILNVGRGHLTSGNGTLAMVVFEANNAPHERVMISLTDVVVSGPRGENVPVSIEDVEWQGSVAFAQTVQRKPSAGEQRAVAFRMGQNFPNPFNPSTRINYTLDGPADVRLTVYDATGKIVRELVRDNQSAGQYAVEWNGTNELGSHVASGTYFSRLTVNGVSTTQKMLLAK